LGMLFSWAAESARSAEARWSRDDLENHRLSRIHGMKVENLTGDNVGRLKDLVLDVRQGQLKYGIIGSATLAGLRSQQRIVPSYALSLGTAKRNTLALGATLAVWKQTPQMKKRPLIALADPILVRKLKVHYPDPQARIASRPTAVHETGGPHGPSHTDTTLPLVASALIGKVLLSRTHERLGEVVDLLVDFKAENAPLLIVSSKTVDQEQHFVVPLRSCRLLPENKLLVSVNHVAFQRARPFDPNDWAAVALETSSVYRYEDGGPGARR
jgi:sporulation protein YlmC with PRC-barrel domain